MTNHASLYEIASELIAADTVSVNTSAPAMERLADRLEACGFRVRLQRWGEAEASKANLVAVAGPPEPGGLALSGHLDVVPFAEQPGWTREPLRLGVEGRLLYGRGTSDMKAFLAQCVDAAARVPLESLRRPLALLFTSDEEIGCLGAERLAPELGSLLGEVPPPSLAWIGEPTSWRVFHAHKGIVGFRIRVHGEGGHSSRPDAGVNAISVAARVIALIGEIQAELRGQRRADFEALFPEAPYTTLNVGTIRGGSASNMIAESCEFVVSYRPLPDEDPLALHRRIAERVREAKPRDWGSPEREARIEVGPATSAPGALAPRHTPLERALRERLGDASVGGAPYCTDAGQFTRAGIDSIICGPGDLDQAHQPNEHITREAFESGTAHLLAVISRLCASPPT